GAGGFQVRNPIPLEIRREWGLLHTKSYVVAKRSPASVVQKYPHWPGLPKKGVRPGEDHPRREPPTSIWKTGFIGYNKMIQALPEQVQYF
ncbi:hypothetical protein AVEN_245500-1, partial [Araneus ventricosus]